MVITLSIMKIVDIHSFSQFIERWLLGMDQNLLLFLLSPWVLLTACVKLNGLKMQQISYQIFCSRVCNLVVKYITGIMIDGFWKNGLMSEATDLNGQEVQFLQQCHYHTAVGGFILNNDIPGALYYWLWLVRTHAEIKALLIESSCIFPTIIRGCCKSSLIDMKLRLWPLWGVLETLDEHHWLSSLCFSQKQEWHSILIFCVAYTAGIQSTDPYKTSQDSWWMKSKSLYSGTFFPRVFCGKLENLKQFKGRWAAATENHSSGNFLAFGVWYHKLVSEYYTCLMQFSTNILLFILLLSLYMVVVLFEFDPLTLLQVWWRGTFN